MGSTRVAESPTPSGRRPLLAEGRFAVTAAVLVYTGLGAAPSAVTVPEWICHCLILGADGNYLDDIWVL